jgi:hypothetical protein
MRIALVVLVALARTAHSQCDPFSSSQTIEIPKQLRLENTCGNGRIDMYATSCDHVQSGGCGQPNRDENYCRKELEVCDGRALSNTSCKKLGFTGGPLRCQSHCMSFDTSACTLCPAGSSCHEEHASEYAQLRLMVQGEHVRVYYTQEYKTARVADVDLATGALVNRRVLGARPAVMTQIGTSAIGFVGTSEKPELVIVKADGAVEQKPASKSGALLAAYDQPLGVIVADSKPNVIVIDETGAPQPTTPLLARDEQRTLLLEPLTPGSHHALWDAYEADLVAKQGDVLFVMRDTQHTFWLGVLRDGVVITPPSPKRAPKPSPEAVVLDGQVVLTINAIESIAHGVHHRVAVSKPTPMLGELAYRDARFFTVAQTATTEVHAALIYEQLAIAVRKATAR